MHKRQMSVRYRVEHIPGGEGVELIVAALWAVLWWGSSFLALPERRKGLLDICSIDCLNPNLGLRLLVF